MYTGNIRINSIEAARSFVEMTAKYNDMKITLVSNEYEVDAHSIIGILSLDLSHPLTISAEGGDLNGFVEDLKPYTV